MSGDPNTAPAVPEEVLEEMASAMLERRLGVAHATGNAIRKEVLKRALSAAESLGWSLRQ